jgi:nonsense-mediated mRNA decay protein 3
MDAMPAMPARPAAQIPCCLCGSLIAPNNANMCSRCLQTQVDITEGLPKQVIIHQCRGCERFLRAPQWVSVAPESRELLAVCLRKIRGLGKVKLIDAGFIWTEPHSKRIKVRLTIQKEVFSGVVLQQVFVVEFVVTNLFCDDCHANAASNTWTACVQVRQRVPHKRTIMFIEQLILKHDAHLYALKIQSQPDGIDFFFGQRSHALRFISFLESISPLRSRSAKELVSADLKSNVMSYKFTHFVEIVPLCKHDIMVLPKALAAKCGQITPTVVCERVTTGIRVLDPFTGQRAEFSQAKYWHYGPFSPLATSPQLVQFIVLDCELVAPQHNTSSSSSSSNSSNKSSSSSRSAGASASGTAASASALASASASGGAPTGKRKRGMDDGDVESETRVVQQRKGGRIGIVELVKLSDFGVNDTRYTTTTHLGHLLKAGDHVLGYDMDSVNFNDADARGLDKQGKLPGIVLVRKYYPKTYAFLRKHGRNWKLRSLNADEDATSVAGGAPEVGKGSKKSKKKAAKREMHALRQKEEDTEAFMQDLQEDDEMRSRVNLYRREGGAGSGAAAAAAAAAAAGAAAAAAGDSSDSEMEDDFPEIQLSEMLDELSLKTKEVEQAARAAALEATHLYPRQKIQDKITEGDWHFSGTVDPNEL